MLDDLAGKRTGERIQILRERKCLSRPVLAGLVGMSASWLKGIEQGRRLPPRLPVLVKLAEALAVGDVTVPAPAIRNAIRDPMLTVPGSAADASALAGRVADAWVWHNSQNHRTDVGRILPALLTDTRTAARTAPEPERRAANALLTDVYALAQHVIVWASAGPWPTAPCPPPTPPTPPPRSAAPPGPWAWSTGRPATPAPRSHSPPARRHSSNRVTTRNTI